MRVAIFIFSLYGYRAAVVVGALPRHAHADQVEDRSAVVAYAVQVATHAVGIRAATTAQAPTSQIAHTRSPRSTTRRGPVSAWFAKRRPAPLLTTSNALRQAPAKPSMIQPFKGRVVSPPSKKAVSGVELACQFFPRSIAIMEPLITSRTPLSFSVADAVTRALRAVLLAITHKQRATAPLISGSLSCRKA